MLKLAPSRPKIVRPLLTANWLHLAMLNYEVDPTVLQPHLPRGTELDYFRDKTYLSIVAFEFFNIKLLGFSIPWHRNLEEVNLRFYIRRAAQDETRRGVVFIKELAPRLAVEKMARWIYAESYQTLPMRHSLNVGEEGAAAVQYQWRLGGRWHSLSLKGQGQAEPMTPGSLEEFIAEHYWAYSAKSNGGTLEYQVEHPPWRVWKKVELSLDFDPVLTYGPELGHYLKQQPASAFLVVGSPVSLTRPERVE